VFPNQLSTDFPVADVRAVVENVAGEPIRSEGVALSAQLGQVTVLDSQPLALLGEYQGTDAVDAGEDLVRARLVREPARGVAVNLEIGFGAVPSRAKLFRVFARPLGSGAVPVVGELVRFTVDDGQPVEARSGEDGWAVVEVPVSNGSNPIEIMASTDHLSARTLAVRGSDGFTGPGTPDLEVTERVTMAHGRAANLRITTSPSVLFNTPRALAYVTAELRDRAGELVTGESLDLSVSEGRVVNLQEESEGVYVWEYHPEPGVRTREVEIKVSSSTLAQSTSTTLTVAPPPVERAVGVSIGAISNFGAILSPHVSIDNDVRLRVGRTSVMIRTGLAWYQDFTEVTTGLGEQAELRMFLVPVTVGGLLRHDVKNHGLWFGLGLVVAPYRGEVRFGEQLSDVAWGVLPPGVAIIGGYGLRVPGGEITVELRGSTLFSPGAVFPYRGSVGGLAALLGYRVVY